MVKTFDFIHGLYLVYGEGDIFQLNIGQENKNSWTHLVNLGREQEALANCETDDPLYVGKLRRIIGDYFYKKKNYSSAIEYYFNSELSFEEALRLFYKLYKQNQQILFASTLVEFLKKFVDKIPDQSNKNKDLRIKITTIFLLEICSYNYSKQNLKLTQLQNESEQDPKLISSTVKHIKFFQSHLEYILSSKINFIDEKIARQILESHNCFELMNHLAKKTENYEYCVNFYIRNDKLAKAANFLKQILDKILGK